MGKKDINKPTSHGERGRQPGKILFENGTYDLDQFHDVFVELEDPTEYKAALALVGSWKEWNRLKRDWKGFNVHINEWKEEIAVKLRSRATEKITALINKGSFQASKWIAEQGYEKRSGAGRPSKAERDRAAKEIAEAAAETKEEKARVLKLLKTGEA